MAPRYTSPGRGVREDEVRAGEDLSGVHHGLGRAQSPSDEPCFVVFQTTA
ncbi:MAG TPA: hypothetical protein VE465_22060 [Streptosporangiaceae bacterium]|nr:hypothetical protein [Streptosporangiaceae bacterium]